MNYVDRARELERQLHHNRDRIMEELDRAYLNKDAEPVRHLARQTSEEGLALSEPETLIAVILVLKTLSKQKVPGSTQDPYLELRRFSVEQGLCTHQDLEVAWCGLLLNDGLMRGWMHAPLYDRVLALGEDDPDVKSLLARVERR